MHKVASLVAGCLLVLFLGVTAMVGLLSVYRVQVLWADGDPGNGGGIGGGEGGGSDEGGGCGGGDGGGSGGDGDE